jgi:4-amino-4-deoxy-L-arabinose transferase-like glycosyltransferase
VVGLPGGIVPTYPPGLPLVMAAAQRLAGEGAVHAVVPLQGGVAVWLTFLLGRRLGGARAGLAAALLLASSPVFLAAAVRPMSDLPATM